jgi:hypothetical protein
VAPGLGRVLDQLLPEVDVLNGLVVAASEVSETTAVEWYLVLRGLLVKIVVSIAPGSRPHEGVPFTLDHEFLPIARIIKVGARVDPPEGGGNGVAQGIMVEILHDSGSWTIDARHRVERADIVRFVSAVLKEITLR